ncbi:MAG TPA: antitoxin Xre-like helix-turn-helix domain-containing protein [Aquiluna sp.]
MSTAVMLEMQTDEARVVQKAVLGASEELQFSKSFLGQILGLSPATVTRMFQGSFELNERSKEYESAVLVLRLYAGLADLLGSKENIQLWLNGENSELSAKPVDMLVSTEGLLTVVGYLESIIDR